MKNRLFIWSLLKIAAGLFFLFIKYDLWKNDVGLEFWDWVLIVIVSAHVFKAFIDIDKVTSEATEE